MLQSAGKCNRGVQTDVTFFPSAKKCNRGVQTDVTFWLIVNYGRVLLTRPQGRIERTGAKQCTTIPLLGHVVHHGAVCVVPGVVNELNSRKCRKLLQSSKRVVCVELFEGSFGVVLESKLLKVWKRTFNSKTSLKQV